MLILWGNRLTCRAKTLTWCAKTLSLSVVALTWWGKTLSLFQATRTWWGKTLSLFPATLSLFSETLNAVPEPLTVRGVTVISCETRLHPDGKMLIFLRKMPRSRWRRRPSPRSAPLSRRLPMVTTDYDLWVHIDDIEKLNQSVAPLDLIPTLTAEEARRRDRYALEDGEHVDVLVARSRSAPDGARPDFDDAWARREEIPYGGGVRLAIPSIDDLIRTKRWAMRNKDVADLRLLEGLKHRRGA
jgi:hypothetical protein